MKIESLERAKKELVRAKAYRTLIITAFVGGLALIGVVVAIISSTLGQGDFGSNFLTEMIGSALTLVLIEIVFNRLENRAEALIHMKEELVQIAAREGAKQVSREMVAHMVAHSLRAAYDSDDEVNAEMILRHLHRHNLIKREHLDEFIEKQKA